MIVADFSKIKDIYNNMKIFILILLISMICVNLEIIEEFSWIFTILTIFFMFFTKWKLKNIANTKEGKKFLLITLPLSLFFIFFIKKETILSIPKEYIGILMAGLVSVIMLTITEYANKSKGNKMS